MGFELTCNELDRPLEDLGMKSCGYTAKGGTMEEFMADAANHAKTVHGFTDEQMQDPALMEQIKAKIRQV